MNAFDGVLTTIGVLMGNCLDGVWDLAIPIRTGIATSIAMGISGLWGAYLTETAERQRELSELERACLVDQRGTKIGRASRLAVIIVSVVDGAAPFVTALFVLTPLFFAGVIGCAVTCYLLPNITALITFSGSTCSLATCPSGALWATASAPSSPGFWPLLSTLCSTHAVTRHRAPESRTHRSNAQ